MTQVSPGRLGDLIGWLSQLNTQEMDWELRKLTALREWALEQAGIDYAEGDAVVLAPDFRVDQRNPDGTANGWWSYRECLAPGAKGTAVRIDFSPRYKRWAVDFRPDREWSVGQVHGQPARWWHGPAADTPSGYEEPSSFDRENYPAGRRHVFMMWASDVRKAPALTPAVSPAPGHP